MTKADLMVMDVSGLKFGGLLFSQLWEAYSHVPCLKEALEMIADGELSKSTNCVGKVEQSVSHWEVHELPTRLVTE